MRSRHATAPAPSPRLRTTPDPQDLRAPAPHTEAELAALVRMLAASRPQIRSVAVGHSRFASAAATAADFTAAWETAGGEVPVVVDWPEDAASWLRPARRFTACAPDAWVVTGPPQGWAQMSRRLHRSTDWAPGRTFAFASLDTDRLPALAGAETVEGLRGVSADGGGWEIQDGRMSRWARAGSSR